jgi:murein DD-endopeptidase MepM/ murein hydrolase activator NlpD
VGGAVAAASGAPAGGRPTAGPPRPVTYVLPVPAPLVVLRGFDPPATPYGPGHLGADLQAAAGGLVRSAGPGTVRFAGPVAGRGLVVVQHPDGVVTEYEPLHPLVRAGASVTVGEPLGRLAGRHRGCGPRPCLHWGARRGGQYFDPLSLLRPLGPVRLLPWRPDG